MELTIQLTPEMTLRLCQEAGKQGVTAEAYVQALLELVLDPPTPPPICGTPLMEETRQRLLVWARERLERPSQ